MEDCMKEVANQFAIPPDKREHWKSTYAHAVRDALNNRRNNTSQDLKKELKGEWRGGGWENMDGMVHLTNWFPILIYAALRKEYPGIYASASVFCNVRKCDAEDNFEPFWIFFDRLVGNIAGKKTWTNRDKVGERISRGGKITIVDEAFTILALQNYWPKWFSTTGVLGPAKWTDSRQGNSQYMGWHEDAYSKFDQLCRIVQSQRQTAQSKNLELTFQQRATLEYATIGGGSRSRSQRNQPAMLVFNELASSNDAAV